MPYIAQDAVGREHAAGGERGTLTGERAPPADSAVTSAVAAIVDPPTAETTTAAALMSAVGDRRLDRARTSLSTIAPAIARDRTCRS